jgi:HAD superfamily hydrolase (TIGR01509 family)
MPLRAILFDLDNTLWRSEGPPDWESFTRLQAASIARDFATLGLTNVDRVEFVRNFWASTDFGSGLSNGSLEETYWLEGEVAMSRALALSGAAWEVEDARRVWHAINDAPLLPNIRPFPDAASTLSKLSQAGWRQAIVTNRPWPAEILNRRLRESGLTNVFEALVTSADVGVRKPHALVFETALRDLGVNPEDTVLVGDSYEIDIVPAAVLGMTPVLKLNEREPDPAFTLARHQISSLADLFRLPPLLER